MTDRLSFFARSADAPRPGLGPGERVLGDYGDLAKIIGWRRMLADEYAEIFVWSAAVEQVGAVPCPSVAAALKSWPDQRHSLRLAKFQQTRAGAALLATREAELWLVGPGRKAVRDRELEVIRGQLRARRF